MMSNAGIFKAAVIGCGRMGALTTERTLQSLPPIWLPLSHANAIASLPCMQLVAVCDVSADQVERVATRYPGTIAYTDHLALLDEQRPDIVGVATRTEGRCAIIRDCAERGVLGIHAEKPLARSVGECRMAVDAMRKFGVAFTFGAVRRYMAPYLLARQVMESGEVGRLRQIVIEHGSDMLMWGHPHTVDLAMFFCPGRNVSRVQSRLRVNPESWVGNVLDCDPRLDMAYLEFQDGVSVVITAGHGFNVRLYGETGSVTVVGDGTRVELRKKAEGHPYELDHSELAFDAGISGTKQAFLNLAEHVNAGIPTGMELDDVVELHKILFAMALSEYANGQAFDPQAVPEDFVITGRFGDLYA